METHKLLVIDNSHKHFQVAIFVYDVSYSQKNFGLIKQDLTKSRL